MILRIADGIKTSNPKTYWYRILKTDQYALNLLIWATATSSMSLRPKELKTQIVVEPEHTVYQ